MRLPKSLVNGVSLVLLLTAIGSGVKSASAPTDDENASNIKFAKLHTFTGADGGGVYSPLLQAHNGDFYGTTFYGGSNCGQAGCGTVFKFTRGGAFTTIYNFCAQTNCTDGEYPTGGLVQATNGELYGTTFEGGAYGLGTVFKITSSGTLTTIYSANGSGPVAGLVEASNGDLYGTTGNTIFKITPLGVLTTLYYFCSQPNCADGEDSVTQLFQATHGDLYGTTLAGGLNNSICEVNQTCGTVFKISPAGAFTSLYNFCRQSGCSDGANPGALFQASNGEFYGTTALGGIHETSCVFGNCGGTIFKFSPRSSPTTFYSFCSQPGCTDGIPSDGFFPSGLIQAASGNFYGTTSLGGTKAVGTIFKISPSGTLTTLYNFCSQPECSDGASPSGLIQGTDGVFYGTTSSASPAGTIFALSTGLAPFVETSPHAGKVSEPVTIYGYKLTGASSVTFNGIPAAFSVLAATEISATIPPGATSGKVQVTTPTGTLSSKVAFEVAP